MNRLCCRVPALGLGVACLLLTTGPASAQFGGGGFGGSMSPSIGGAPFGGGFGGGGVIGGGTGFGGTGFGGGGFSGGAFGGSGFGGSTFGRTGFSGNYQGGFGGAGGQSGFGQGGFGSGTAAYGMTGPEGPYFVNPLSLGVPGSSSYTTGNTRRPTFGVPLFGTTTGTTGTLGSTGSLGTSQFGNRSLGGGLGTATTSVGGRSSALSSIGIRRAPAYTAELGFPAPPPLGPLQLRADLQQVIDDSSRLQSKDRIRVLTDGQTVVLRGQVRDDHERRLAEALVRLTPGVHTVVNELTVAGP